MKQKYLSLLPLSPRFSLGTHTALPPTHYCFAFQEEYRCSTFDELVGQQLGGRASPTFHSVSGVQPYENVRPVVQSGYTNFPSADLVPAVATVTAVPVTTARTIAY